MSSLQSLKNAATLHGVALLLGIPPKMLAYILYHKAAAAKYTSFPLQKASGGLRLIQAPSDDLKRLQRNLSILLQDCAAELNAAHGWKDQIAHGFKRERSIVTNAHHHRGRRWVFNLDLADFFGSINFGRVRGFFINNKHFALNPKVATILAQIACHDNSLPQGSPCSPVVSNLIAHILDIRLVQLAQKAGCTYTRYADDLTFSTNLPSFPSSIATLSTGASHSWSAAIELTQTITHSGFTINAAKSRMQYRNSRQDVTGLVVNKKVNIRSEYRRAVRAMVYSVFTTGGFYHKSIAAPQQQIPGTMIQLHGMLGHIDSVDLYNKRLAQESNIAGTSPKAQMRTKESQYRRFLIFEYFYNAQIPVIICEGKTDNIYITQAIKGLATSYPGLATVSPTNAVSLKVRIFKYPETSTGRILELHGGTGDLMHFIRRYPGDIQKFKAPGLTQPVVVLVDNDDGKNTLNRVIKDITKQQPTWTAPFIHLAANLYVMPTPLIAGTTESAIEDFFSPQTLNTVHNGKTFSADSDADKNHHFGKAIFAEQVIKKNVQTIDFSGFIPVLNNLVAVIADYAAKQIP
jgi:RNA-directed DNA polymerase